MRGKRVRRRWWWGRVLVALALLVLLAPPPAWAEESPEETGEEEPSPAVMRVRGFGFMGNRSLMRMLQILRDESQPVEYFNANQIEDGALILLARLQQEGYLQPEVEADVTMEDGEVVRFVWDETLDTLLPRPIRASRVVYRVQPGVLFYYRQMEIEGLTVMGADEATEYFVPTGFLIRTRRARAFTDTGLERGIANLREVLIRRGFENARVTVAEMSRDHETGAVDVRVRVQEGRQSLVRSARTRLVKTDLAFDWEPELRDGQPFSRVWTQDYAQELRLELYRRGYPDADVRVETTTREDVDEMVMVDLLFTVEAGPFVEVGEVIFRGQERTQENVLRRRSRLGPGDPLNRVEAERGRTRLARLGAFEWVDVELEEVDETTRNVVYNLREGRMIDVNLLFGYGSYEMLRGGIEVEQFNIFGRAHRSRLLLTQSLRASSGNYRYTVPELFGEDIHGYSQLFALRREEREFDRVEFGGSVGAQTFFHRIDTDANLRYTYQLLETRATGAAVGQGLTQAVVAAVGLDLQQDRRDNPIYPEAGHSLFTNVEVASTTFGGEVEYQRLELGGSYHLPLRRGRFIHTSLQHGIIHTFGEVAQEIPFNRRFFPGGENTMRGFLQGEASPRNAAGEVVGAESYVLLNVEFEQALTPRWSVVAFSDSIGIARSLDQYPFEDTLYSVGLGIRYKTLIGPVRLEYGHNLNPRPQDSRGALHLSIGFPF
jgi:outer membrane protein insertion porin family